MKKCTKLLTVKLLQEQLRKDYPDKEWATIDVKIYIFENQLDVVDFQLKDKNNRVEVISELLNYTAQGTRCYSYSEVAKLMHLSRQTIYNIVKECHIAINKLDYSINSDACQAVLRYLVDKPNATVHELSENTNLNLSATKTCLTNISNELGFSPVVRLSTSSMNCKYQMEQEIKNGLSKDEAINNCATQHNIKKQQLKGWLDMRTIEESVNTIRQLIKDDDNE